MNTTNANDLGAARRNYRPLVELGRGGMARVYLAESLASGIRKLVVLKVLNRELVTDLEMRAAFRREAELSARMNHPNVVQVLEVVEHSGTPVMVMEYLDGLSLAHIIQHAREPLPLTLHLHVLTQILAGLHHFHELKDFEGNSLNAVHRDVSPQNVLVLHDGPVKVLDFGIAKVHAFDQQTRSGMIKGKLHYMPPEQLLGEGNIDRRADVFAVGVMLWEAVAGRRLWAGCAEGTVVRALARGELPRLRDAVPDVSPELERIVQRAMHVQHDERYETAEQMQLELEHVLAGMGKFAHSRELSTFMAKNFGERRQFRQRAIERALREPVATLSGVMECVTPRSMDRRDLGLESVSMPIAQPIGPAQSGTHTLEQAALYGVDASAEAESFSEGFEELSGGNALGRLESGLPNAPGSTVTAAVNFGDMAQRDVHGKGKGATAKVVMAVLLLAGLLLAVLGSGTWLFYRQSTLAPVPATQLAKTVTLRVVAHPDSARVTLDGVELGVGRVEKSQLTPKDSATLRVEAPGFVTEQRTLNLASDVTEEITLQAAPEAAATEAPAGIESPPASRAPAKPHGPGKAALGRVRSSTLAKSAKAQPQASAATSAASAAPARSADPNCNPPYRLTADGVQVFKPECF